MPSTQEYLGLESLTWALENIRDNRNVTRSERLQQERYESIKTTFVIYSSFL